MNRDLARAQEITKDSETAVSVYIDPAVIKEIASGFKGIRTDLETLSEVVSKIGISGIVKEHLNALLEASNIIQAEGVDKEVADKFILQNQYAAKLLKSTSEINKKYGGWENVPEDVAAEYVEDLKGYSLKFGFLVADNADSAAINALEYEFRNGVIRLASAAQRLNMSMVDAVRLVNDYAGYSLWLASDGALFKDHATRAMEHSVAVLSVIPNMYDHGDVIVNAAGARYVQELKEIEDLRKNGDYQAAAWREGELLFDVIETLAVVGTAGYAAVDKARGLIRLVENARAIRQAGAGVELAQSIGKTGATIVDQAATGIQWGKGIQGQGVPFENYIASTLPAETRLPANFKIFDFFDIETGVATSVKTLDTTTAAKVTNPSQIYYSLKGNVDAAANFSYAKLLDAEVTAAKITTRELNVAIPANTTPAQWVEIDKAIRYGQSKSVTVKITVVK